jgi:hypothetical protein
LIQINDRRSRAMGQNGKGDAMPSPIADLPMIHQVYLATVVVLFTAYPLALLFAYWTAFAPDSDRSRRRLGEERSAG